MKTTTTPLISGQTPAPVSAEAPVHVAFVRSGARELYAQEREDFLAPATALSAGFDLRACLDTPEAHIAHYLSLGLDKKEALKAAAKDRGVKKSDLYRYTVAPRADE